MKIQQIYDFLNSYNKQSGMNLFRFFRRQPDDLCIQLLQQFVNTKCTELSGGHNNENEVSEGRIALGALNQDIPFEEFKNHLREYNQLVFFETYLREQLSLPSEQREHAYKLFSDWRAKEAGSPNEILSRDGWREVFEHLDTRNLVQVQRTCRFFANVIEQSPVNRANLLNYLRELNRTAQAQYNQHSYEEALLTCDEILRYRRDPNTLHNRGLVLHRLGRINESSTCFSESQRLREQENPPQAFELPSGPMILINGDFSATTYVEPNNYDWQLV